MGEAWYSYTCIGIHIFMLLFAYWYTQLRKVRNVYHFSSLLKKYRHTSNIGRTESLNLNVSRLVLQLSLTSPLKPDVKSRMKIYTSNRSIILFCTKARLILEFWRHIWQQSHLAILSWRIKKSELSGKWLVWNNTGQIILNLAVNYIWGLYSVGCNYLAMP